MRQKKKDPPVLEQLEKGGEELTAWARGELKLRATFIAPDGTRTVANMTKQEVDEFRKKLKVKSKPEPTA